ncbi:MAG: carbohydrate binding domain-containing protein, partial [Planctomycetota bacterium]
MKRRVVILILMFLLIGTSMVNAQEIVNLFDNPGFEEGEGTDVQDIPGWQLYKQEEATGLLTIDTEEAIEGNQCVFIEVTGVPAGGTWNLRFDHIRRFSVVQGTTYTMSFWLKGDAGPITLSASRAEQNDAGQWGNLAQEIVNPTEEWQEYHMTFESSEDRLVMWQLLISNPEQTYYVDHARCYEGEYVPGRIGQLAQAYDPIPEDGSLHPDTWVNISWESGDKAVSHDVYFSDNYDLVHDGAAEAFQGNQGENFFVVGFPGFPFPDGLVNGATYYWRIDEVNEVDPNSPWKGTVWSFSVPPKTAYAPDPADAAEQVYQDIRLRWTGGFGSKVHTVYFGDNFDDVNNAEGGLPQATPSFDPGPLELAKTYYWRIDEFDIIETYKGNVWSFTTEGAVGSPEPANGAVDVDRTQIITWSPSVFAASHEVYFGIDKDAVKNANIGSPEHKGT